MSLPRLDHNPREDRELRGSPPMEWVPAQGCWCVYDAEIITSILKSVEFVAADFAELHRGYERKVGIDCSSLIRVLNYIATANEGKRHAEIRRDAARVVNSDATATKEATAAQLTALVARLCYDGTRFDLVKNIIRPVCDTLFECVLGAPIARQAEEGVSASQIFDIYLGLNRRREINNKARAMLEGFTAANGKLKTSPDHAAGLAMLGYDSIVASLGCSLLQVITDAAGQPLHEIAFPRSLPATGVPYIERFASADLVIEGVAVRKGDRVRLYLDTGAPGESAANRPYFGRGRHSCLGEELSTWLWTRFADEFSNLPLRCTIEAAVRRKPDWVFVYYSSIEVSLHA